MVSSPSPSPDVEGVAIGSVLDGRYRIDAILGTGGMGRVYRGEHTGIGRAVAIKVLHADLNRNREAAQRFQREALASGRLDHPNIVGVSDFGVLDGGACYLVMEALEGEALGARLAREKRIPWTEAVEILRGVLSGLRHAHDRGVVHRDIKPDNIFLANKDGEHVIKILDFGIAKLYAGSADDPASTRAGLTVGTPAYLSPEQAVGGEITPASDLYSTTIVLFEMLAGRPPFEEKEPLAMLGAHVSRTPPSVAEIAAGVDLPPGLEDVITRGLTKVATERFTSALDYLAALDVVTGRQPRGSAPMISPSVSAHDLGVMETGTLPVDPQTSGYTPIPLGGYATPVPGTYATPVPGTYATPAPGSAGVVAPTMDVERARRAVSIADISEPIPRRWFIIAAVVLVVGALIAIILAATRSTSDPPKGAAPTPLIVPVAIQTIDRDVAIKAALLDLKEGKTCGDRRAAVVRLAEIGDPSVVDDLKRARYRMRGGFIGIGEHNANRCLKADADAAIKKLTVR